MFAKLVRQTKNVSSTLKALGAIGGILLSLYSAITVADDEIFHRAQDLRYGEVLFEYHQGHLFEALSLINVAKEKGGVQGHGDHPALIEGGLMLAYGMTAEAKTRFESVLKDQVSPSARNRAWYYLGKVSYLEENPLAASESFAKVDAELLQEDSPALAQELIYLQGQLALRMTSQSTQGITDSQIEKLPKGNLWRAYLLYNKAVGQSTGDNAVTRASLEQLVVELSFALLDDDYSRQERKEAHALLDRSLLSIGQLALSYGDYAEAVANLERIELDSVVSDDALYSYAITLTHTEQYERAIGALNILRERKLFSPWTQQVPYALAYLYELMGATDQAYQAYVSAGKHYEQKLLLIESEKVAVTEEKLLASLDFVDLSGNQLYLDNQGIELSLGMNELRLDAYGRIAVAPNDYTYANLLASERFQLGLRDLHELYKLQDSLSDWKQQLASFDVMLETRQRHKAQKVEETLTSLSEQNAERWLAKQVAYADAIESAIQTDDPDFFMTQEQKDFSYTVSKLFENLAHFDQEQSVLSLEELAEIRQKAERMRAYLIWDVAQTYSVNRWQAEKELRQLNDAMEVFDARHEKLKKEIQSQAKHQAFVYRVETGKNRLDLLSAGIEQALNETRANVIALVHEALDKQQDEVNSYLFASKRAQARLADALYLGLKKQLTEPEKEPQTELQTDQETDLGTAQTSTDDARQQEVEL